jgi:glutaredoxin
MTVKLFSKPNCIYCDKVKNFIKDNNIQGVEYDESANVAEVRKHGGMQFPMLLVDEQGIFGSDTIISILEQLK